jgi:pyruvate,water dikinase
MAKKEAEHNAFIRWFSELSNKDISIAGGKGASLAEMYNNHFPIPSGFIVTAQAYSYFIENSGLNKKINEILADIDIQDTKKLDEASKKIKEAMAAASFPLELNEAIIEAYDVLDVDKPTSENASRPALTILKNSHEPPFVAVRSSATTEDLADASFAGQQESFLNTKGEKELLQKVKECFASLFNARAIYYRIKKGFGPTNSSLAVVVQRMIDSDKSGVIFSKSPVSEDEDIVIEAVWGLGEGIVSGRIKPDNYVVNKNLEEFKIKSSSIANKKVAITRDSSGKNHIVKLTEQRSNQQVLTTYEIKILSQYARKLEEHYKKPQDIEFAISGNEIYIVQSRPITTKFAAEKKEIKGEIILSGLGASPGVASGRVKIIFNLSELEKIKKGDILVTEMTNPDMVVSMQKAAAIVTDEGGVTSHAAIVSREMGIPAVVGTGDATKKLKEGQMITVDGSNGKVLTGEGETKLLEIKPIVQTKTKIKVVVDLPDFAERAALTGAKSVGLTRIEGIIAESGKHPFYFVEQKKTEDYSSLIFEGLKKIAQHFDEMWIRTSDIRSDEFQHLEGAPGKPEGNPMLGNHGIRFSLKYPEVIKAEIKSIKQLAIAFPKKAFGVMIPQVISLHEVQQTKKIAQQLKIPENVKIGIMVETPAAVQIINSLCEEGISFISFGTNDLTQYMLAVDRNNGDVQYLYDEMNSAVVSALSYVIRRCKKHGIETSICGQAGSKPSMVNFLISEGIDSISVNADAAESVSRLVQDLENKKTNLFTEIKSFFTGKKEEKGDNRKIEKETLDSVIKDSQSSLISPVQNEDIEDVMLKELDSEELDSYVPGQVFSDKGIPLLNDAIPVDSEQLNANYKASRLIEDIFDK